MAVRLSVGKANDLAEEAVANLSGGFVDFYTAPRPVGPGTAITTQVKLARATLGSPAFGTATGGVVTANAITGDVSADATGDADWARVLRSNGTTADLDVKVDEPGGTGDLVVADKHFTAGQAVNITSLQVAMPTS
jgi:hypothetical protein